MVYDYLQTIFRLISGLMSKDTLIYISLTVALLLGVWIVISLVISSEFRFSVKAKKLQQYIDSKGFIDFEDPEYIALVASMPQQVAIKIKSFEQTGEIPSKYLTQTDCIETPLYGGIFNQNRSIIKSAIWLSTIVIGILNFATAKGTEILTGLTFAENLVLPGLALLLYYTEYYVYTSIRQYYYKLAVARFNELVETLCENYERTLSEEEDMEEKRGRGRPKKTEEEKVSNLDLDSLDDFDRLLTRAEMLVEKLRDKELSASQQRRIRHELSGIMQKLAEFKKEN